MPSCPFCGEVQPSRSAEQGHISRASEIGVGTVGDSGSQVRSDLQSDVSDLSDSTTVREGEQHDQQRLLIQAQMPQPQIPPHILRTTRTENSPWSAGDQQQQEGEQEKEAIEEERIELEQQHQQKRENIVGLPPGFPGSAWPIKDDSASSKHAAMLPVMCTQQPSAEDAAIQSQPHISTSQKQIIRLDDNCDGDITNSEEMNDIAGTATDDKIDYDLNTNAGTPESQSPSRSGSDMPDPPLTSDGPATGDNIESQSSESTLERGIAANLISDNRPDQKVIL